MRLAFTSAPDDPAVQAVTYGPVVLSGLYGASYASAADRTAPVAGDSVAGHAVPGGAVDALPLLDVTSVRRIAGRPMTFAATADARRVTMVPVARAQHQHYTVYWQTSSDRGLRHPAYSDGITPVALNGERVTATKDVAGPQPPGTRAR
jgi:hypothetical protein